MSGNQNAGTTDLAAQAVDLRADLPRLKEMAHQAPDREQADEVSRVAYRSMQVLQPNADGQLQSAGGHEIVAEHEQRGADVALAAHGETFAAIEALAREMGLTVAQLHAKALEPTPEGRAASEALSVAHRGTEERHAENGLDVGGSYVWKPESLKDAAGRLYKNNEMSPEKVKEALAEISRFEALSPEEQERAETTTNNALFSLWHALHTSAGNLDGEAAYRNGKNYVYAADALKKWCAGFIVFGDIPHQDIGIFTVVADGTFGAEGRGNSTNFYAQFPAGLEMARRIQMGEKDAVIFHGETDVANPGEVASATLLRGTGDGCVLGIDHAAELDQGGEVATNFKNQSRAESETATRDATLARKPAAEAADKTAAAELLKTITGGATGHNAESRSSEFDEYKSSGELNRQEYGAVMECRVTQDNYSLAMRRLMDARMGMPDHKLIEMAAKVVGALKDDDRTKHSLWLMTEAMLLLGRH